MISKTIFVGLITLWVIKFIATLNAQTLKEYKCGFCGETFGNKLEFMKHRKMYHQDYVMPCRDFQNGACVHGSDICWFKHDDIQTKDHSGQADSQESQPSMMSRLFTMMEQFAERMNNIENQL